MHSRLTILAIAVSLLGATPAFAQSEITGTLSGGSGSTVGGTVIGIPTASPTPGTYGGAISVTLTSPGSSSIRYTTDGTTPSCAGGGLLYIGPITVSATQTIQAVSCYSSGASSTVGSYSYVISGGSLSGTVATSSAGTLSGTVTSSPGGTLSGTVTSPSTGGGGSGGGGGSTGGGSGSIGGTVTSPTTGGTTGTIPGVPNTGGTTGTPGFPNTGSGGDWLLTLLALIASASVAGVGAAYLRYRTR